MYILLVGNTGVGKSSVMSNLSQKYETNTFSDPYIENPFLSSAYLDNNKIFQSQMFFFKEFLKIHLEINSLKNVNIIQERSIFECVSIFCQLFLMQKKIDKNEFYLLSDLLDTINKDLRLPDAIIYLKSDIGTISNRIKDRNRDFENSIDCEFLMLQTELYNKWVYEFTKKHKIKLIEVDNSKLNIEETTLLIQNQLSQINFA